MMERNPCCFIDGLYGECESWFLVMIGTAIFGEWEVEVKDELNEARWGGWKASIFGERN